LVVAPRRLGVNRVHVSRTLVSAVVGAELPEPAQPAEGAERADPAVPTAWPAEVTSLFLAKRTQLVRLAHLMTGSNGVAEEIVQEAFLRLRQRTEGAGDLGGYVYVTVVNLARGHLRKRAVEERHVRALGPDRTVTGDPEIDETWAAMRRLPAGQRAVLVLRFYEDLPESEIARLLGCRLGTVKSRLHRGLGRLRKELS
jgi:RNA polymerase sigma-70 factor (sigma-E family)